MKLEHDDQIINTKIQGIDDSSRQPIQEEHKEEEMTIDEDNPF